MDGVRGAQLWCAVDDGARVGVRKGWPAAGSCGVGWVAAGMSVCEGRTWPFTRAWCEVACSDGTCG